MRQIIIFSILIACFSCTNSKQSENEVAKQVKTEVIEIESSEKVAKNIENDSLFNLVREELFNNIIIQPETYKSVSWGNIEIMDNPIFRYRISHIFSCAEMKFKPYDKTVAKKFKPSESEIFEYEMFFHLDSTGKIVASSLIEDYRKHFTKDGQLKVMFSNFEFEKIGRDNFIDMLFNEDNSKTLIVISERIPFFKGKVGMTKNEFQRVNFRKLDKNILSDIDTVYFGVYEAGGDDIQFIFENDTIVEIK